MVNLTKKQLVFKSLITTGHVVTYLTLPNYFCKKNNRMITASISNVKLATCYKISREIIKLNAIKSIEDLISTIDFSAEIVPIEDNKKLQKLLTSLKGEELSLTEIEIIKEISEN